jgi:transposase
MVTHKPYPSDVSDAEWQFVAPYLCLLPEDAGQRVYDLRDVFDALRWLVRSGAPWRYLPADFPPWEMVYQQTRRWLAAGCFEAVVHDLRAVLRFGVSWQVVPRGMAEMLKDPAAAKRAMAAVLKMKKLDIAELRKAYEG